MKTKFYLLLIAGLLLFALSTAEAGINWTPTINGKPHSDEFNYIVWNSGIYFDLSLHTSAPISAYRQISNLGGGSGQENQAATATNSDQGLGMASAAWGQQLPMGASVSAYTNAYLSLDDTKYGVSAGGQSALSFINRTLTVDTPGVYTLTASASAPISWTGTATGTATASLDYNGTVTLTEYDTTGNGATQTNVWSLSLSQLLDPQLPHSIPNILLKSGDTIYYTLNVGITGNPGPGIFAQFNNYTLKSGFMGTINGEFNAGSADAPFTISASFSVSPNPGPPKEVAAIAGDAQATVTFLPPRFKGRKRHNRLHCDF